MVGAQIVTPLEFLSDVKPVIRHHHERPDGEGYPDGLSGSDIHPLARIISVADAFDAMTSPRPYRPPKSARHARSEILKLRDVQFDAEAADTLRDRTVAYELDWSEGCGRAV